MTAPRPGEIRPFQVVNPADGPGIALLTHVPHSSTRIPRRWRDQIVLSDEELERELLLMTDRHTDELFSTPTTLQGVRFVNQVSRLVFDPERFPHDADEPMANEGMGAVYVLRQDGTPLRRPDFDPAERAEVIQALFEPYANALAKEVDYLLEGFGRCVILDAHSFPTTALPYENPQLARPDICIGFDPFHCPEELVRDLEEICAGAGLSFAANEPFAGSYVPLTRFQRDARVVSVMIEVRRGLYMDEASGVRAKGFEGVRSVLEQMARRASEGSA